MWMDSASSQHVGRAISESNAQPRRVSLGEHHRDSKTIQEYGLMNGIGMLSK